MKYLITASFVLVLFSCQKQNTQPQLISQLGFDVSKTLTGNTVVTAAISFKSMEDAKAYFSALKGRTYSGNVRNRYKLFATDTKLFDILKRNDISVPLKLTVQTSGEEGPSPAPWEEDYGNDNYTTTITDWTGWCGYQIGFTWERNSAGMPTNIGGFSSGLVGFTLGVSWDQKTGSAWTGGTETIHYSITGFQNYNIIVEGIGTIFSQSVTISGTYNTSTGAFTIQEK